MYQGSAQFINTFTNDIINHDEDPVNMTNDRYFSNKNQHKVLPELNLGNINDSTIYSRKSWRWFNYWGAPNSGLMPSGVERKHLDVSVF